ncbi:hypothetical protein KXV25_001737 [Aspergillus fumigatus]|nr:hypothetical protein KXV25_001737 [Aspergillus fumigatus]
MLSIKRPSQSPADSSSSRYRIGKATASQRVRNPVRDSPSTPSRRVERRQRTGTSPTKRLASSPPTKQPSALSPFFAAACCRAQAQSPSPDSPNKRISISLPDEQPEILSCILEYLYKGDYTPRAIYNRHRETWELENTGPDTNGQTTNATIFHHATGSVILRDTAVYCAAQKYGLEPLKRLALRKQGLHSGIQCSTILSSARYAYANTPDDESKLRAHYLALIIRCRSTFKRSGTMQMEMEKGGKLFFDLFVAMCNHMDDLAIAKSSLA